ncbi:MAG: diacylglycerol kinase family lipid kinase [Bacillota bacterium]|nr:diacylglycerol kinase family lipid kinase [Bacillota bacterium]
MRRILFLVNPIAGKGRALQAVPEIEAWMRAQSDVSYEIAISTAAGEITQLVKQREADGIREFVAVGGDGTISEMINGIGFSEREPSAIGVIPTGRGNDFVRNFDHPSLNEVMDAILRDRRVKIDVGAVNSYYFLNSCSFGIDGPITADAFRFKKRFPGEMSYLVATLKQLMRYRAQAVRVEVDGESRDAKLLLAAISNGRFFGGGMKVAPTADLSDGVLDLCLVNDVKPLRFLFCFPKIYSGRLDEVREVSYRKFESLRIIPAEGVRLILNIDGNLVDEISAEKPADIRVCKQAIELFH